eukprot:sb/3463441/
MKGELTASAEDDTSWTNGACAEDHSGWVTIIADCSDGACAKPFELGKHDLEIKYSTSSDADKYVNFFDVSKEKIGFLKWKVGGKVQPKKVSLRLSHINQSLSLLRDYGSYSNLKYSKCFYQKTRVWSHICWRHSHLVRSPHVCGDHTRCLCHQPYLYVTTSLPRRFYQVAYCTDAEELDWTKAPAASSSERTWKIVKSSTQIKILLDGTEVFIYKYKDEATCKAKFEKSIMFVSFYAFTGKTTSPQYLNVGDAKLSPDAYYSLEKIVINPACSFSVGYSKLSGNVEWYFKDEKVKTDPIKAVQLGESKIYNITSTLDVQAIDKDASAILTCIFKFTNEPSLTWQVGVGLVYAGYKSVKTTNSTGLTDKLTVDNVLVSQHGKHDITVSSNSGDSIAQLQLYVIDVNRMPASSVLQQKGVSTSITCNCINWKDNATEVTWNKAGTSGLSYTLSTIKATYASNFNDDTEIKCKFNFPEAVSIERAIDIDVFTMSDVAVSALADTGSTVSVEFPISGLYDFSKATIQWALSGKTMTIPSSFSQTSAPPLQITLRSPRTAPPTAVPPHLPLSIPN